MRNEDCPSIKTLGIMQKSQDGILIFKYDSFSPNNDRQTKRSFLKKLANLFDPLGFLLPFVVQGKILLQVWLNGSDWYEPLPRHLNNEITEWWKVQAKLSTMQIPRCL